MRVAPQVRPAIVRWGVLVFALLFLSGGGLAQPPIPGHPNGAVDDLGTLTWSWEEVRREGLVVDLLGRPNITHVAPEIAYRVHGDIAAIEGSLLRDASRPAAQPVFNTGARLFEIVFEPPLALADGGRLQTVRPPLLNWTGGGLGAHGDRQSLTYDAVVPHPANDTTGPFPVLYLHWSFAVNNVSSDRLANRASGEAPFPRSPAMGQLKYQLTVNREALSEEGARGLNETAARFAFLFDFGGSANGRMVHTQGEKGFSGLYLYRGDAAATFTLFQWQSSRPLVRAEALSGGAHPSENVTNLLAPIALNATLSGARPSTHSADYRLDADFGYLLDLPEPPASPTPTDDQDEDEETPAFAVPAVLLLCLLAFAALRRTEAHR